MKRCIARDARVVEGVHRRLGEKLRYSCQVGITHWNRLGAPAALPGPAPVLFFAPDHARIAERMAYKYPPGAVRRLDDALLATFGERYVNLVRNADRVDLLRARLAKLRGPTGTMTE